MTNSDLFGTIISFLIYVIPCLICLSITGITTAAGIYYAFTKGKKTQNNKNTIKLTDQVEIK